MMVRRLFKTKKEAEAYIPTYRKHHTYTNEKGMKSSISPTILKCHEPENKGKYMILEEAKL
jgi:hypothetical protein